ncbi:helix-turn-helix domain-containing protein [Streptomyces sp. NPDC090112]|uniref:helix-turn-helix domain-containing protein n=1 Tax=Streptomyces sp. NPDC090112 TaxID=3365949 RepID=UPI00381656D0
MEDDEWMTTAQFAKALQVNVGTVRRWARTDPDMKVKRLGPAGRNIRIHRSELNRTGTQPTPAT